MFFTFHHGWAYFNPMGIKIALAGAYIKGLCAAKVNDLKKLT